MRVGAQKRALQVLNCPTWLLEPNLGPLEEQHMQLASEHLPSPPQNSLEFEANLEKSIPCFIYC